MKKTIPLIVMAMLCLIFGKTNMANAQDNKAIDVTKEGIQIGQKVPEVLLNNINNYKAKTAKLSDFNGKLVILDFWATWCSPCIAMIPKMEALQAQFKDQIQILTVTYQTDKDVLSFFEKLQKGKPSNLPEITGDKDLHKLFPHIYLPHYVWIDKDGIVKSITGYEELTAENIKKMLNNDIESLKQKKDLKIKYDSTKPLLLNGNGGNVNNLIYHSLLTGYSEGIPSIEIVEKLDNGGLRILLTNATLKALMQKAYTTYSTYFGNSRTILDVKDTISISAKNIASNAVNDWLHNYSYCYELILPPHLISSSSKIMREELDKLIPKYKATVVNRKTKCLALVRTSSTDKLKHQGAYAKPEFSGFGCTLKGSGLSIFLLNLNGMYQQTSKLPLVDLTGYTGKVDMILKANLNDINALNEALSAYDLKFEEREAELEMLVISDRDQLPN